ncbi:MAG: minichromosome maintenance protein MCM [Hadesarchaea archaeon]|nr:minichromosome maintenance protein MCM [Hadesarchaea archaeon]
MKKETRNKLENFLQRKETLDNLQRMASEGKRSLEIDFDQIVEYDMDLADYLLENPTDFIEAADEILEDITDLPGAHLRVRDLGETVEVRKIRSSHVGKFIQIEGVLTRASDVKPEVTEAVFECQRCGEENKVLQTENNFRKPTICQNPNCGKKGPFQIKVEKSDFRDWQSLRIQERPENLRGGKIPRNLDAIVRDDFVDKATPGNRVTITGVLRAFQEKQRNKRKTTFRKILHVNHIEVQQEGIEETELSPEDEEEIEKLADEHRIDNLIVNSVAPSIFGYDKIKEAISLQLFGCKAVELPDESRIRGDTHVLLTGDPGTAKSQLLKRVTQIVPRGIYTSGKKATGAGLTAAAVKDEIGGGWTLEAGALAVADGGLAGIDEFDKMDSEESGAILESMEQQTISVAKAGIVATLNTRTSILAAANPRMGRFDEFEDIAQQIDLSPLILSRFDLIFILQDKPSEEKDRDLAGHMLELHSEPENVVKPQIDTEMLRKIIIYARKYVDPQFSGENIKKRLEDFFVQWRKAAEREAIPITARQLEALVRLSKASARMRLSEEVEPQDVERAIKLVKHSLKQVGIDSETGKVDVDTIMTGHSGSQRDKFRKVMKIIERLEEEYGDAAPIKEVKEEAASEGIKRDFVEEMIKREKEKGRLYEPEANLISRAVR